MKQKLVVILLFITTPILSFSSESPVYWNAGQATLHFDSWLDSLRFGFEFESITLNLKEPVTGFGLRLKPFEGILFENDYTLLGSGLDLFWSPFPFLEYSRLGLFVSGRLSYYPNLAFHVKAGLDFTVSMATLFEDSEFPMVTDLVQLRAGYYSENHSLFISISTDILLFIYFIAEIF